MATQAQRSAATQSKLLEATIACLVERGYQGTSTARVCERAGVSKGAAVHHYGTKAALFAAAVEHLLTVRLDEFQAGLERGIPTIEQTLDMLWGIYSGPTLVAWMELLVAGRADRDLGAAMAQVNERFGLAAEEAFRILFRVPPEVDVSARTRLILAFFDGLATTYILDPSQPLEPVIAELRSLISAWEVTP